MPDVRLACACALVALQLFGIALGQLGGPRYFAWAPLHEEVRYRIRASLGGRQLTAAEIEARYHYPSATRDPRSGDYWELNAIEHVFALIARYEREQPAARAARVRVDYRRNGREPALWTWPP